MTAVAVLTPDPTDLTYADLWPTVLQRLQLALAEAGLEATPMPWTDHVDSADGLRDHALVLPLIAWGYHCQHERWLRACATWRAAGVPMANPPDVLSWNSDKRYLERLAQQGVPVPETRWSARVTPADIEAMFAATGASQLIVKPAVSGGAWQTQRVQRGRPHEALPDSPSMIQAYVANIEDAGETSLVFFDGRLSHVVNKRPVAGEFRIQVQYGGIYTSLAQAPAGALALAEQTLSVIGAPLLYARIDTVPDASGRWLLMEAELIEPDFYLGAAPEAGARFAHAVRSRL